MNTTDKSIMSFNNGILILKKQKNRKKN